MASTDAPTPDKPTQEEITADLRANPRYQPFFEGQRPEWVADFIREYSQAKYMALRFGDFHERQLTDRLTRFEQEAYERLWDIQQKKLFDLQCRWRAGQVEVPGVQLTCDFWELSGRIENCGVLPPITPDEVALYCAFLAQVDDYDEMVDLIDCDDVKWYDYEDFKANAEDPDGEAGEELPAWYDFHNDRTGAGSLLLLPDVRGSRERYYRDVYRAHRSKAYAAQTAATPPPPHDPRPIWVRWDERPTVFRQFARQYESSRFMALLDAHLTDAALRREDEADGAEAAIEVLRELGEPVAMLPHPDWREALRLTAGAARRDRVLALLPAVYEAYQLREAVGIQHPGGDGLDARALTEIPRTQILKARALLGEPENFDF